MEERRSFKERRKTCKQHEDITEDMNLIRSDVVDIKVKAAYTRGILYIVLLVLIGSFTFSALSFKEAITVSGKLDLLAKDVKTIREDEKNKRKNTISALSMEY